MKPPRGLFRWPGGKKHLVDRVAPLINAHRAVTGGRLISLFAGSLAIERAVGGCAIAADASPELLNLYEMFRLHSPEALHNALVVFDRAMPRTSEAYKALGHERHVDGLRGMARFLWLSSVCFNGVWRVNGSGEMNMGVDAARLAKPAADLLPPVESFQRFAAQIEGLRVLLGWQAALEHARAGDVVLADPPYGEFDGYTAAGFGDQDHRLLANALRAAFERGVAVIAFNAPEAAAMREQVSLFQRSGHLIYGWARIEEVLRAGSVSSKGTERGKVGELLITAGLRGGA